MYANSAGDLLRNTRLRHGLSQESLAIRAGKNRAEVADIEEGRASPKVDVLRELLELLGENLVLDAERQITGIDLTLNRGNLRLCPEHRVLKGLAFADLVRQNRPSGNVDLGRPLRLGPMLHSFAEHRVAFVVIGSIAGLVHGSAYPTYDLDVAYAVDPENRERLLEALHGLGIRPESGALGEQQVKSFETPFGTLDILRQIPGVDSYEELWRNSGRERIAGVDVRVASLDHLIAMKRAANRVKDQLMVLEYVELADEIRRREEDGRS